MKYTVEVQKGSISINYEYNNHRYKAQLLQSKTHIDNLRVAFNHNIRKLHLHIKLNDQMPQMQIHLIQDMNILM